MQNITVGSSIRFSKRFSDSVTSEIYVIRSIQIPDTSSSDKMVEITFETEFGDDVDLIYDSSAEDATCDDAVIQKIERIPDAGNPEYDGKFFLKLNNTAELKSALFGNENEENLKTIATNNYISFKEVNSLTVQRQYFINRMDPNGGSLPEITTLEGTVLSTPIPAGFHMVITNTETWDETIPTGRYKDDIFSLSLKEGNYIRLSAANKTVSATDELALSQLSPPITLAAGTVCEGGGEANDQDNYRILKATTGFYTSGGETKKFWALKLPEGVTYPWDSNMQTLFDELNLSDQFTMDVRGFPYNASFTPFNPALFEVEAKENGLDIYYETQKTYPISELSDIKSLNYANCFSFGNGVESDRIRDDFENLETGGQGSVHFLIGRDVGNGRIDHVAMVMSGQVANEARPDHRAIRLDEIAQEIPHRGVRCIAGTE